MPTRRRRWVRSHERPRPGQRRAGTARRAPARGRGAARGGATGTRPGAGPTGRRRCRRTIRMKGRGACGRARGGRRPGQAVASLPKSGEPDGARRPRAGRTSRRLAGWPVGRLAGWPVGRLAGWPVGRLAGWPVGRLAGWPVGRLAGWLIVLLDADAPAKVKRESACRAAMPEPADACATIPVTSGMAHSSRNYSPFAHDLAAIRRRNQAPGRRGPDRRSGRRGGAHLARAGRRHPPGERPGSSTDTTPCAETPGGLPRPDPRGRGWRVPLPC